MEKKMREEIIIYGMLYITFLLWNYQISYIKDMRKMMDILCHVSYIILLSQNIHTFILRASMAIMNLILQSSPNEKSPQVAEMVTIGIFVMAGSINYFISDFYLQKMDKAIKKNSFSWAVVFPIIKFDEWDK